MVSKNGRKWNGGDLARLMVMLPEHGRGGNPWRKDGKRRRRNAGGGFMYPDSRGRKVEDKLKST